MLSVSSSSPPQPGRTPYRQLTTARYVLVAGGFLLVGLLLLYVGGMTGPWWDTHGSFRAFLQSLGGLLVASVFLGSLWELVGKRSFAREVLETAGIAADVETAGLSRITTNYLNDTGWDELFANVEQLDIFLAYGATWRNVHLSRLETLAARAGAKIRIFLPDPEDRDTMTVLCARFGYEKADLKRRINETRSAFEGMARSGGAQIEVWFRPGDRVFSFYRFDSTAVITFYNHKKSRDTVVPTLVCRRGGSFFQFIETELVAIESQSRRVESS